MKRSLEPGRTPAQLGEYPMSGPKLLWTSPIASQEIEDGPELIVQPGRVVLRYRGEGHADWIELRFRDILSATFTEFSACSAEQVSAYDRLLDLGNATPLAGQLGAARRDTAGMRHFRIFLDDVGTYDVVAREVETP
jgi:hypothetical protein